MSERKPRIAKGPHYVYVVIGIDGSIISDAWWWPDNAVAMVKRCGPPCRVEKFRLVRVAPKKRAPRSGSH